MATINQSLAALLASFPAPNAADTAQTAMAYMLAVDGLPAECVAEAVKRFIRGEVDRPGHRFLPSTAEVALEARKIRDERAAARFKALPKAEPKPVSKEDRAKVAAMMERLAKRFESDRVKQGRAARFDPDADLEILKDQPVRVSSALVAKLQADERKS